jgi:serine/threonine protein kinase
MSEIELSALPAVSLSCHHTFTEQQMAVIAKSILSAMVYLHSKGQVARYIRPENVLINEDGVVKLAGFGLNLLRHAADAAAGSPRDPAIVAKDSMYLAPEIRGGSAASLKESKSAQSSSEPNAKSDIWAMAVTLIQLSEDRHHASSRPENGGAVSPLSARRNTTSDPDGAGSPSTAPGRSIMLQSRSSLMMNNPFQDFIAKCLLPRADQRSDAASLLKHPFITRFAATQSSDGNASSTVDLHESKEQFPFRGSYNSLFKGFYFF